jgi:hypothetical protein
MACIHIFLQIPYRQMEGFVRKIATFIPSLTAADYTALFRRIQRLNHSLPVAPDPLAGDVIIAVDSTGIKVTNRGEWMREKWRVLITQKLIVLLRKVGYKKRNNF